MVDNARAFPRLGARTAALDTLGMLDTLDTLDALSPRNVSNGQLSRLLDVLQQTRLWNISRSVPSLVARSVTTLDVGIFSPSEISVRVDMRNHER